MQRVAAELVTLSQCDLAIGEPIRGRGELIVRFTVGDLEMEVVAPVLGGHMDSPDMCGIVNPDVR